MCRKKRLIRGGRGQYHNGNSKESKRPKDRVYKKPPGLGKKSIFDENENAQAEKENLLSEEKKETHLAPPRQKIAEGMGRFFKKRYGPREQTKSQADNDMPPAA
ncbi:MAG: hypothetical protein HYT28_03910 [Parcubacteria group bacterium]|nr:hypothetical protein [Parcubacteria group bacterium]